MSHERSDDPARKKLEARLFAIVQIAADAIITIDERHRITMFNDGAEQIFGYRREEIVGQPLETLLPERFRPNHAGYIAEFASGPIATRRMDERRKILGRRKSGDEFSAEASISKIEGEGERMFAVVLRDVSERDQREEELRQTATRLRLAREAAGVAFFEMNLATDEGDWGEDFQHLLGMQADSPRTFQSVVDRIHPDDRASFLLTRQDRLGGGRPFDHEVRVLAQDGRERWLAIRGEIILDPSGKPSRLLGAGVDITDIWRGRMRLEAAVAERTNALQNEIRQREKAQATLAQAQRMEALGQLTGGIAHDSNNLLTVITGNLEMAEEELDGNPALKYVREAQEAARMGARLNQRLLTFSRRRDLAAQVINLNDQVLDMSALLQRTLGGNINLSTALAHDLGQTRVDPSEIENAILNLALNARDAMPDGGDLRIETKNATIDEDSAHDLGGVKPGPYVQLSVSDTGAGMTPEVVRHAFEPYFTTKGPGKGTGLGLSSLYGFVKQSHGHVNIYSEPGRGTVVNVFLPRLGAVETQPEQRGPRSPHGRGRGETVLVVEDNAQVRRLTVERLRRLGYRIIEAENGPQALEILKQAVRVDIVFSDVVMPGGMSGFDLAREVRAGVTGAHVLLTSGFSEAAARGADPKADQEKLLRKPYSAEELARALRDALAGWSGAGRRGATGAARLRQRRSRRLERS